MDPACWFWKKGSRLSKPNALGNFSASPNWNTRPTTGCGARSSSSSVHRSLFWQRWKLVWCGHITRHDSLSKTILQDTLEGGRRRGRQRKCWMDNIKAWTACWQGPLAEKTGRRSLLNRPSCPPRRPNRSVNGTELPPWFWETANAVVCPEICRTPTQQACVPLWPLFLQHTLQTDCHLASVVVRETLNLPCPPSVLIVPRYGTRPIKQIVIPVCSYLLPSGLWEGFISAMSIFSADCPKIWHTADKTSCRPSVSYPAFKVVREMLYLPCLSSVLTVPPKIRHTASANAVTVVWKQEGVM